MSFFESCQDKILNNSTPRDGMASTYPEPEDKEAYIRTLLYDYNYEGETNLPKQWPC